MSNTKKIINDMQVKSFVRVGGAQGRQTTSQATVITRKSLEKKMCIIDKRKENTQTIEYETKQERADSILYIP